MDEMNSLEESLEAINEAVLNSIDETEIEEDVQDSSEVLETEVEALEVTAESEESKESTEGEVEETASEYTTFEESEPLSFSEEDNIDQDDIAYPEESDLEYPESFELELQHFDEQKQEDQLWQARTGLNEDTLCGAIETIIFMSDRPVPLSKIKNLIDEDLPLRVVHEALQRLQEGYEMAHHGLRLLEVAEGYQFRTKATYSKYVQDLFKVNSLVLSPTALEVLAILAYKQPVSKNEVEKIRGVDSSHIVRGLMDKRLVKVVGRSDEAGRPALYGTTPEFLEVFNLADLDQLPPERELDEMSQSTIGKIGDIKTICAGDKTKFNFEEMEELEALGESIKSIASDTEFTRTLGVEEKKRKSASGESVRSAFDLLEEFVTTKEITDANENATQSEPMTAIVDPQVVKDLNEWPLNAPEVLDDEDFQMIDLDTGEAIELADDELDIVVDLELTEEEQAQLDATLEAKASEESNEESNESDSEEEGFDAHEAALAAALAAQMSDQDIVAGEEITEQSEETPVVETAEVEETTPLFDDNTDEISGLAAALDQAFANLTGETLGDEEELREEHNKADEKAAELDDLTNSIVDQASDLDIDLSFLKEDAENNSETEV